MVVLQTECKEPLTNRPSVAVGNITQWAVLYNRQYHAVGCITQWAVSHNGLNYTMGSITQWAELHKGQYHTMGCITQWAVSHNGLHYTTGNNTQVMLHTVTYKGNKDAYLISIFTFKHMTLKILGQVASCISETKNSQTSLQLSKH